MSLNRHRAAAGPLSGGVRLAIVRGRKTARTNPSNGSCQMIDPERKQAWRQARAAVRAYSKDPSDSNAAHVELAWQRIRRMDGVSFWREWHVATLSHAKSNETAQRS
jgi:hypothetical protein